MKYIQFILVLLLVLSDLGFSQKDTVTVFFDKKWSEIQEKEQAVYYRKAYQDSDKLWIVNDYFISNKIQMTGTFKDSKFTNRQGHFIYYYENGNKESEGKYFNDKNEGLWTYYFENGSKKSEGEFVNDKNEGLWNYWFETGEHKSHGNYLHSVKDGLWKYYHKNGMLDAEESFVKGHLTFATGYYDNGALSYKGAYQKDEKNGEWIFGFVDGRITLRGSYKNGVAVGEWTRYFHTGEMKLYYNNGLLTNRGIGTVLRNNQ